MEKKRLTIPVSRLKLEKYLSGHLSREEAQDVERLLGDKSAREALDAYRELKPARSFEDFQARLPELEAREKQSRTQALAQSLRSHLIFQWISNIGTRQTAAVLSAVLIALACGIYFLMPVKNGEMVLASRGAPEVRMLLQGIPLSASTAHTVSPGDSLQFQYLSDKPIWIQVWYRDDGGIPRPYLPEHAPALKPVSRWTLIKQGIVLEDGWSHEAVWVLWRNAPFASEDAELLVQSGKGPEDLQLKVYSLSNQASGGAR